MLYQNLLLTERSFKPYITCPGHVSIGQFFVKKVRDHPENLTRSYKHTTCIHTITLQNHMYFSPNLVTDNKHFHPRFHNHRVEDYLLPDTKAV